MACDDEPVGRLVPACIGVMDLARAGAVHRRGRQSVLARVAAHVFPRLRAGLLVERVARSRRITCRRRNARGVHDDAAHRRTRGAHRSVEVKRPKAEITGAVRAW